MKHHLLMENATPVLNVILGTLTTAARRRGLTDTAWAAAAGVRKETLSRLRGRGSCDFATLEALATAVGLRIEVSSAAGPELTADGLFPVRLTRDDEERLVDLLASRQLSPDAWRSQGPAFFMAGLAVMLASVSGFDRRSLLLLAEQLHPGASQVEVFALWLERAPVQAERFLPMVLSRSQHAA